MAKKNGIRPEIAGGRTLSRMLRGSKSDGGNKKKGRKQTWFTPATYDILIAEKSAMEGKPIKLPAKVADPNFRCFKEWPSDGVNPFDKNRQIG